MKLAIYQFHGCEKCFHETLLLENAKNYEISRFAHPTTNTIQASDAAIITGYLLPSDQPVVDEIIKGSKKVLAYGSCATTGGIFGLAYQKGTKILPLDKEYPQVLPIHGCLGEIEEVEEMLSVGELSKIKALCNTCTRKSENMYLDEVNRQIDPTEDEDQCFNDLGFLCSGYTVKECKERCIDHGAPCRGCKPSIDRPGFRMIGMFGTVMGQIEVATEANKYGATDKLADKDDEITESLPDVTGNFFRYDLAKSVLPIGRQPSSGNIYSDIFNGRLIEELPLITGSIGGVKSIAMTLDVLHAYEMGVAQSDSLIEVSEKTATLRASLLKLEEDLEKAVNAHDVAKYQEITTQIRTIAGNMNMSKLFFGGFRTPIAEEEDFDSYKAPQFTIIPGKYQSGSVSYTLDEKGVVSSFSMEGN